MYIGRHCLTLLLSVPVVPQGGGEEGEETTRGKGAVPNKRKKKKKGGGRKEDPIPDKLQPLASVRDHKGKSTMWPRLIASQYDTKSSQVSSANCVVWYVVHFRM